MRTGRKVWLRSESFTDDHCVGVERVPVRIEHLLFPPKMREVFPVRKPAYFRR